jgi:peroxiredoxin
MATVLLIARAALAAVFIAAALGKLAERNGAREAIGRLGVPLALTGAASVALPLIELTIAAGLLIVSTARWAAIAAAMLLAAFSLAIAQSLARGKPLECHCFGNLGSALVGRGTLVRNATLFAVAVFVAVAGWGGAGTSLAGIGAGGLVLAAIVSLQAVFSWQLFQQNGRLLVRVSALEDSLGQSSEPSLEAALQIGVAAPSFVLPDLDGTATTLEDLLHPGRGLLLVFSDPSCGHCDPLLPALGHPRDERDVPLAVISRGPLDDNRAKAQEHGIGTVLVQKSFEVADAYRVYGLPGAVLVDADGRIASARAVGADEISVLLGSQGRRQLPLLQVETAR